MKMKKLRVYIDTSVVGGVFDSIFAKASIQFFKQAKTGRFQLVSSAIMTKEIEPGPQQVKGFFEQILPLIEIVPSTQAATELTNAYLNAKIVSKNYKNDAFHVALATVNQCPVIVSWNFKHIVHFDKMSLYNAVNTLQGYNQITIVSPLEVIKYD